MKGINIKKDLKWGLKKEEEVIKGFARVYKKK